MKKTNVGNRKNPQETVQNRTKLYRTVPIRPYFVQFAWFISTVSYVFVQFCTVSYIYYFDRKNFLYTQKNKCTKLYETVRFIKTYTELFVFVRFLTFSYVFVHFLTFSCVSIFRYQFEGFHESQKIVDNRKKPYEICPNWNGFLQFCTVLYGFLRFLTISYVCFFLYGYHFF